MKKYSRKAKAEYIQNINTARAQRLTEHESAIKALQEAKRKVAKYQKQLVMRRTKNGFITALPYTMQRLEVELKDELL